MKMLTALLIALLWSNAALKAQPSYFPNREATWEARSFQDAGLKKEAIEKAVAFATNNEYSGERDLRLAILKGFEREPFHELMGPVKQRGGPAGMVIKDGYLVASWGDTKRVDMTFSVTKSFLSTVAGMAVDKGLIAATTEKVADYVWDGKFDGAHNSKITWHHLLNQSSDWSGELWGTKDWADRPPQEGGLDDWKYRKLNEPGAVFEYNDVRVNLLAYSVLQVWRKPLPQVLKDYIMDPIGASTTWRWFGYENSFTVVDGMQMQSVSGGGHSGGGLFMNTQDLARFGLLFLNNGKWDGKPLISPEWIRQATAPSEANVNYGYMWWLNQKGARYWEGVPENVYYAAGFGGNFIVIVPDQNMVVVMRWLEPSKVGEFMRLLVEAF